MAIIKEFINMEALVANNDSIPVSTLDGDENIEILRELTMTTYSDNVVSMLPTCRCGYYQDRYFQGDICPKCHSEVIDPFTGFKSECHLDAFPDVGKWISPTLFGMISSIVNTNINLLRWVGDNSYNPPLGKDENLLLSLKGIPGFRRDYIWLCSNIEHIIEFLMVSPIVKKQAGKDKSLQLVLQLYRETPHALSTVLPLLNKKMFVVVKTDGMGEYGNSGVGSTLDVCLMYLKAAKSTNVNTRMNTMCKIVHKMASLFELLSTNFFGGKGGILRNNAHGARFPFTARSVIVPIIEPHDYNDVHLPWGIAVTLFRPHILPTLLKSGYTLVEANKLLHKAVKVYVPEIHDILQGFLDRSPNNKIPIKHQRNPSLEHGSSVLQGISKIKTDPTDTSCGTSCLGAKIWAGDFDGDEKNIMLLIDKQMARMFRNFEAQHSVLGNSVVNEVSGKVTLTDPGVALVANAIKIQRKDNGFT